MTDTLTPDIIAALRLLRDEGKAPTTGKTAPRVTVPAWTIIPPNDLVSGSRWRLSAAGAAVLALVDRLEVDHAAALRFADEQGAEAIDRVSRSIVADKWNSTAEFQARAVKAEAALEEAMLTLAAEQGKPEGAPSEGWDYEHGDWIKTYPDGSQAVVSGQRGKRQWMRASWPDTTRPPTYYGRGFDVATDRAAMIAADEASDG